MRARVVAHRLRADAAPLVRREHDRLGGLLTLAYLMMALFAWRLTELFGWGATEQDRESGMKPVLSVMKGLGLYVLAALVVVTGGTLLIVFIASGLRAVFDLIGQVLHR